MKNLKLMLAVCSLCFVFSTFALAEDAAPAISPDKVLKQLKDGNARYVADRAVDRLPYSAQRGKLAEKQNPSAIVLTCSDSRVVPEIVFNQQLGDLFVIRVAGNVTDPVVLGSIEYAVEHLHPSVIVVLGHSSCGAVKAVVDKSDVDGNIAELAKHVYVGDNLPEDKKAAMEIAVRVNVNRQSENLTKDSKVLHDAADAKHVQIVPAVYSIKTGAVTWLKAE